MSQGFGRVTGAVSALAALVSLASAVPFGLQIYSCTTPGVIAPGFDDGPWIYSEDILNRMGAAGFKATWFINGANKGNIYDYNSTLQRMVSMGHQIGSHTWSHKDLATLTADGVRQEMTLLEEAMMNILGYFPYYMRPPFLSLNANALSVLKDLEYHVIIGDLNTKDWEYQSETGINTAKQLFIDGLDQGYTIVEAHDQEVWTHDELINYMISVVQSRGIKTVTVAECLGESSTSQWYRSVRQPKSTNTVRNSDFQYY
ncbi:carbohydrate-binding module family 18 protein [Alternaria sp. MG1]|nr:carbohydrate-binding module family 18 protein [Alternaria sp. MG1]